MADSSKNIGLDDPFDLLSTDVIHDQSDFIHNGTTNRTFNSFDDGFKLSSETMRLLFIAIATITILICLAICISVCICICLNRRRNLKRQEKKDHRLLPEQSERMSCNKISSTNSLSKPINSSRPSNGQQQLDKTNLPSSIQQLSSNINTGKIPIRPYYYDNLDDIPFIDESRPTSYIDITRV